LELSTTEYNGNSGINTAWQRFARGNNDALRQVYKTYHAPLVLLAYHYLKDEQLAKDEVAEVFTRLLEMDSLTRQERLEGVDENLYGFLRTIVKNRCIDHGRTSAKRASILNGTFWLFNRSINEDPLVEADMRTLIDALPTTQRKVMQLHLDGYDHDAIAENLGISVQTSRNTLVKAKEKLRHLWRTFMQ
jgi:RNA polymerase sigma-70 factor (ECF subfamily)